MDQLMNGEYQPLDHDQLTAIWINILTTDTGTPMSTEDIMAEVHRRQAYGAEQPPKRPYRVEDPELQIWDVVDAIRGVSPLNFTEIADRIRGHRVGVRPPDGTGERSLTAAPLLAGVVQR